MIFMRRMFFYSIVPLLLFCERSAPVTGDTTHDRTLLGNAFQMTGILLGRCWNGGAADLRREGVLRTFQGCLKRRCLVALDAMRSMDNIRISDGIELVKYRDDDDDVIYRGFGSFKTSTGDVWKNQVLTKLMGIFENHVLKIRLNQLKNITFEGRIRHRHHHQHLLPVMLFGTMAITMIAIPLGFQFLAVLGGKALLLAKLALILTSIQGLKKIATSNWNYGLYEAPNNNPWPFDRKWLYDSNDEHQSHQGFQGYNQDAPTNLLHPLSPRIDNYYYQ